MVSDGSANSADNGSGGSGGNSNSNSNGSGSVSSSRMSEGGNGTLAPANNGGSSTNVGRSVGIGAGVVGAVGAYSILMIYGIRRYRRHRTTSATRGVEAGNSARDSNMSVSYSVRSWSNHSYHSEGPYSDFDGSYGTSSSPSGSRGIRQSIISPPIMTQHSLGWN